VGSNDLWITRFSVLPEAPVRLVCFPHAGGSASFFHPMVAGVAPWAELLAVQYPGRQNRRFEPCVDDVGRLADAIATSLVAYADRPLVFFGHSMGAVVGFETVRRLERPPLRLFVSGRRAPSIHREEWVHRRDDNGIVAELRALNGTEVAVLEDKEFLQMILRAVRSDYRAIETYRPTPDAVVDCPVTAIIGADDPRVAVADAQAWESHTTSNFDLHVLTGGHFYLVDHRSEIIRMIATSLEVPRM
jgi:surfactin synthase thioesterase subunit